MHPRRDVCLAFSIFAGINVIFDESLGISTELRTAYAVFIILSLVAAVVAFACRIIAAHSMHQVRDSRHKQLTGAREFRRPKVVRRFPRLAYVCRPSDRSSVQVSARRPTQSQR